jgi:CDP-diacylglycerol--glycerol-3-phosphate 3-phosphatidyltransferase
MTTAGGPPDLGSYLDRWRALHGGYEPRSNMLVRRWLTVAYSVARPLARARVTPDALTVLAVVASAGVVGLAALSRHRLLAAAALAVVAGLIDSLDGAVAVLRDRVSRYGTVLDSTCDRLSDTLLVTALWVAGAPAALCVLGGVLMFLQEFVRAHAAVAGMRETGVITVWERPTRVIVTSAFLAAAGIHGPGWWPLLGSAAWVGLGVLGLGQLSLLVRRRLG